MTTDLLQLVEQARDAQQRLAQKGLLEEAQIIEKLVVELTALSPQTTKAFYTASEAATINRNPEQKLQELLSDAEYRLP